MDENELVVHTIAIQWGTRGHTRNRSKAMWEALAVMTTLLQFTEEPKDI
jgi:hypothetical protein